MTSRINIDTQPTTTATATAMQFQNQQQQQQHYDATDNHINKDKVNKNEIRNPWINSQAQTSTNCHGQDLQDGPTAVTTTITIWTVHNNDNESTQNIWTYPR